MIYKCFDERFSKNWKRLFFIYFSMRKFNPPLWLHPIPEDLDLNKFGNTLPASTQVLAFWAKWFARRRIYKTMILLFFKFLIIFPSKRTRLIRITRHAVNQGSKFGKNKNSKKNDPVQDFRGNEN